MTTVEVSNCRYYTHIHQPCLLKYDVERIYEVQLSSDVSKKKVRGGGGCLVQRLDRLEFEFFPSPVSNK